MAKKFVTIHSIIPHSLKENFDTFATQKGLSRSGLIRSFIEDLVKDDVPQQTCPAYEEIPPQERNGSKRYHKVRE